MHSCDRFVLYKCLYSSPRWNSGVFWLMYYTLGAADNFSNSSLDVWSKYNSFWTSNESLSGSFWEEWKDWISWKSSLLRFRALVRSRVSFESFYIWLSSCTWNKVIAVSWACILPDKLFLSEFVKLFIAANLKQLFPKWLGRGTWY